MKVEIATSKGWRGVTAATTQTTDDTLVREIEALVLAHEVGGWPEADATPLGLLRGLYHAHVGWCFNADAKDCGRSVRASRSPVGRLS